MFAIFLTVLGVGLVASSVYLYSRRARASVANRRVTAAAMFDQELVLRRSLNRDALPPRRNDTIYL
jgi:hypothetical protein